MSFTSQMSRIVVLRNELLNKSRVDHDSTVNAVLKDIAKLSLKREQFACTAALNAVLHNMMISDRTLAYEYDGQLYCISTKPVADMRSTAELHEMDLTQKGWDLMNQYEIWVDSGWTFRKVK